MLKGCSFCYTSKNKQSHFLFFYFFFSKHVSGNKWSLEYLLQHKKISHISLCVCQIDNSLQDISHWTIILHLQKGNFNSKLSQQSHAIRQTVLPRCPRLFLGNCKKKLRKFLYMWNYVMSTNHFHLEQMSCVLSLASTQTWKAWHLYIIINGLGFGSVQTFGLQTFKSTVITLSFLLSRSKHFIKFSPHILPINILVILATTFRCAVNILGKLMDALSHFKQPLSTYFMNFAHVENSKGGWSSVRGTHSIHLFGI